MSKTPHSKLTDSQNDRCYIDVFDLSAIFTDTTDISSQFTVRLYHLDKLSYGMIHTHYIPILYTTINYGP